MSIFVTKGVAQVLSILWGTGRPRYCSLFICRGRGCETSHKILHLIESYDYIIIQLSQIAFGIRTTRSVPASLYYRGSRNSDCKGTHIAQLLGMRRRKDMCYVNPQVACCLFKQRTRPRTWLRNG